MYSGGGMSDVMERIGFFFFQAEDGIRDSPVTGVQTCALPIFFAIMAGRSAKQMRDFWVDETGELKSEDASGDILQIGRASCRERV